LSNIIYRADTELLGEVLDYMTGNPKTMHAGVFTLERFIDALVDFTPSNFERAMLTMKFSELAGEDVDLPLSVWLESGDFEDELCTLELCPADALYLIELSAAHPQVVYDFPQEFMEFAGLGLAQRTIAEQQINDDPDDDGYGDRFDLDPDCENCTDRDCDMHPLTVN
jgi:hypothetical protein